MDKISPNKKKNCILCINTTSKTKKIFDSPDHASKIAEILCQHFWFTFTNADKSQEICVKCWEKTNTFHQFYESVREAHLQLSENQPKDQDSAQPDWQSYNCDTDAASNLDEDGEYTSQPLEVMLNVDEDDEMSRPLDAAMNANAQEMSQKMEPSDAEKRVAEYFKMNCDLCGQQLDSLDNVQDHFSKKHKLKRGYLICCCNKKAKMRNSIIEHVQWHMDPNMFRCSECSKTFMIKYGLRKHMSTHHKQDEGSTDCSLCAKKFPNQRMLREHTARVHVPDDQKLTCHICEKKFKLRATLETHIKYKHSGTTQQYICHICAKILSSQQSLQEHTSTHFDNRRIECELCGALLKNRVCLAAHMRNHRDLEQTCDICFQVKPNRTSLNNHKRRVHGTAKHKCNFCGKLFIRPSALREHVATHTGENLYTCNYCPQTFKSNSNMYKHMKHVHTEQWTNDRKRRSATAVKPVTS